MFFGDWLYRREQLSPNKVALIDAKQNDKSITYGEWNRRTNRLANFLSSGLSIRKGDRVSIFAENRVDYLDVLFACNKLGAILHVINWRLNVHELESFISDASPRVMLYSQEFCSQVDELRQLTSLEQYVGLDTLATDQDIHWPTERNNWSEDQPTPIEMDWEDPWVICYTGGTTGIPKGAILNYRCITTNSVNTIVSWGLRGNEVVPQYMPFFHIGGLNCLTIPLIHLGATNIVCTRFDVDQLFDQIEKLDVTFFFGVPTQFLMMIQHSRWKTLDLSNVRLVMSGGGTCPTIVFKSFWEKGVDFKTGYGLTEAGPNTFWLPTEYMKSKIGSVGFPLFHIDTKIVDKAGNELGANETGELLIRGPHVFGGYWNNPEATDDTFVNGWLHTGDMVRRDSDGCFYIVGRIKETIKSGGENIYPAEVEDVMHSHPAIAEAVLIPVPHSKWGEVGRAIVVTKPGTNLSQDVLIAWLRDQIAHFKVPKSVVFVDTLPKTASNKVDKKLLIKQHGS